MLPARALRPAAARYASVKLREDTCKPQFAFKSSYIHQRCNLNNSYPSNEPKCSPRGRVEQQRPAFPRRRGQAAFANRPCLVSLASLSLSLSLSELFGYDPAAKPSDLTLIVHEIDKRWFNFDTGEENYSKTDTCRRANNGQKCGEKIGTTSSEKTLDRRWTGAERVARGPVQSPAPMPSIAGL
ncbi:hypothetical protein WN55_09792 [Dufourea novaeangliae]|uniref:Uncharacterized protein n=1 Tax=Dufourea novaeangliae TaxID=178035 RepID=A0A154P6C1_DUFNO|nr:hypothetical protein WN55_09792 [Dufourea novaeangliae]